MRARDTTPSPPPPPRAFAEPDFDDAPDFDPPEDFADLAPPADRLDLDEVELELAERACFDLVGSAWAEAVRLVPPEFVRFDAVDFSVAARLAEPVFAFVVFEGLLVAFAVMLVFEPPFGDDVERPPELPLDDVAIG